MLIDASKVAKTDEISLMLVIHQTLFDVHFINEQQDVSVSIWTDIYLSSLHEQYVCVGRETMQEQVQCDEYNHEEFSGLVA